MTSFKSFSKAYEIHYNYYFGEKKNKSWKSTLSCSKPQARKTSVWVQIQLSFSWKGFYGHYHGRDEGARFLNSGFSKTYFSFTCCTCRGFIMKKGSNSIECAAPRMTINVNYTFWLMMVCWHGSIDCNWIAHLSVRVSLWGVCAYGGKEYMRNLYTFHSSFAMNLKLVQKNKVYLQ